MTGWGAACQNLRTGGPWTEEETQMHINCLKLLAATFATQTPVRGRTGLMVLLLINNTSAVSYINNLGGTISPELVNLAQKNLALESREGHTYQSPTPARDTESDSRPGISYDEGSYGLETEPGNFQENRPVIGPNRSGPICIQNSALFISAGGQIHWQQQQMHSSRTGHIREGSRILPPNGA